MDQELNPGYPLLESRLILLRDLASSLERAQIAVVESDLAGIDGQTQRQRAICEAMRRLEPEGFRSWPSAAGEAPNPVRAGQRWQALNRQCAELETRVRQLNRTYGALLQRARRTLDIFRLALASAAPTYTAPQPPAAAVRGGFEEARHV